MYEGAMNTFIKKIYYTYFAPDRLFRHTLQHFIVLMGVAIILSVFVRIPISFKNFFLLVIFTYLPDIDGILAAFIYRHSNVVAKQVSDYLLQFKIKKALAVGTVSHKQFNRLLLHNYIVYPLLLLGFFWSLSSTTTFVIIFASLIGHFLFDQIDDLFQLGHLYNWLWPFSITFPWIKIFQPKPNSIPFKNRLSEKWRSRITLP